MSRKPRDILKHERTAYYKSFPRYSIDAESRRFASVRFLENVSRAAARVRIHEQIPRKSAIIPLLKMMRKMGIDSACLITMNSGHSEARVQAARILSGGQCLYDRLRQLDPDFLPRYIPYQMAIVQPRGNEFIVRFDALSSFRIGGSTCFYHRHNILQVALDGVALPVVFTRHACERIRDRLRPRPLYEEYGGAADVFNAFTGSSLAMPAEVAGNPAVALYFFAAEGTFHNTKIALGVLGQLDFVNRKYFTLAGYLPVTIVDGYAIAKTFLMPGMDGTPEHTVIRSREDHINTASQRHYLVNGLHDYRQPIRIDAIRSMHAAGVPQVISVPRNWRPVIPETVSRLIEYANDPRAADELDRTLQESEASDAR